MHVIRHAELVPAPWKNGGGLTREAWREPAGGERFGWRISFAQVDTSGPFSDFSGYTRHLVLLQGAGVRLDFGDGGSTTLRQTGDLASFDGGVATHGELLQGSCLDLNLIVASARYRVRAGVERIERRLVRTPARAETLLIVPLDHPVDVEDEAGESARLGPWDVAVGRWRSALATSPCRAFVAGIVDNGTDGHD